MNIKYLGYFIEISKEKSFTKASQKLYLSQSALSKAIKVFEEELGVQLIDRKSKKFKLTYEGQILYENGILTLKNIEEQYNILLNSINSEKGVIKLGIPPVISTVYFTLFIKQFREKHPNIEVKIIEAGANTIQNKLSTDEIDIGVIILPFEYEDTITTPIFSSDVVAVVNKNHRLAKNKTVSIYDLKDEPLISLNETYMLYDRIQLKFRSCGLTPNIICTSSQWDFIAEMVALNQGISILPRPILDKFQSKNIKILTIKERFSWNIALAIKKYKYTSKAIKIFYEFMEKYAKKMSRP